MSQRILVSYHAEASPMVSREKPRLNPPLSVKCHSAHKVGWIPQTRLFLFWTALILWRHYQVTI
jgi:hypothetical protein